MHNAGREEKIMCFGDCASLWFREASKTRRARAEVAAAKRRQLVEAPPAQATRMHPQADIAGAALEAEEDHSAEAHRALEHARRVSQAREQERLAQRLAEKATSERRGRGGRIESESEPRTPATGETELDRLKRERSEALLKEEKKVQKAKAAAKERQLQRRRERERQLKAREARALAKRLANAALEEEKKMEREVQEQNEKDNRVKELLRTASSPVIGSAGNLSTSQRGAAKTRVAVAFGSSVPKTREKPSNKGSSVEVSDAFGLLDFVSC